MSKLLSILCLFVSMNTAVAGTFTVTTNADAGPGSLREAILLANANGTAVPDLIQFNIPNQSEAGRTITLQTELPALSSNITIDGTTQPGTNLGISSARITLYLDHYTSIPFTYLFIQNATGVSVYGICFKFFADPDSGGGLNYAIGLRNASQVIIGAAGKGNMVSGVREGISNNYWNYFDPDSAKSVTIQGNVFGLSSTNDVVKGGLLNLRGAADVLVGGPTAAEGNLYIRASVYMTEIDNSNSATFVTMQNNRFNINWDGSMYYYFNSGKVELWGNITDDSLVTKTKILNNQFCGNGITGISLFQLYHRAIIQGNKLGLDAAGAACNYSPYHIGVVGCKNLLIGGYGSNEQNIIHGDIYVPKHGVYVLQNQISGIILNQGTASPDPFIRITEYDNNMIRGVANNNAKIQLYTTECPTGTCFLKKYFAVTWADASGNWNFPYTSSTPNLVATATIADSSTSAFSEVKMDHYTYREIKDATCGQSNGSIRGIRIYAGTHIRWYNSANQLISTDTNLVNVPAGTYYLHVSNGANGCISGVGFTINDITPPATLNPLPSVNNASCGQNNGSIVHTTYFYFRNVWYNSQMDSIGNGAFINNLAPGAYFLKLVTLSDTGCHRLYGPFTVANTSGPSLDLNGVLVAAASCGNSNGAITGIVATNVTGTPFMVWVDSLNAVFGNMLNAANLPAGRYRFKFKDASTCDTIVTPYFTVPSQGIISINISQVIVTGSDCGLSNGSITQVQATGATQYQWVNAQGAIVGTGINLTGVPAGNYVLKLSNTFGCTAQSDSIAIPDKPFISNLGILQHSFQAGKCDKMDGYCTVSNFPNPQMYTFYWVDSLQPSIILSTSLTISGINSGTYFLYARNAVGCEEKVFTARIPYQKPVVLDETTVMIRHSTCNLPNGSIYGLGSASGSGLPPFTYTWFDGSQVVVGQQQQLNNVTAGNYNMIVNDANGCADTSAVFSVSSTAAVLPKPICPGQSVRSGNAAQLRVQNPQPGGMYYLYNPASSVPISQSVTGIFTTAPLFQDITFSIEFVSGTCTSERTGVPVKIVTVTEVFVPTAFTPNKDGKNDQLRPLIHGQATLNKFIIYNIYGAAVFSTSETGKGWDGTFHGKEQPAGTYVWFFSGIDQFTGRFIQEQGSFVLIR